MLVAYCLLANLHEPLHSWIIDTAPRIEEDFVTNIVCVKIIKGRSSSFRIGSPHHFDQISSNPLIMHRSLPSQLLKAQVGTAHTASVREQESNRVNNIK